MESIIYFNENVKDDVFTQFCWGSGSACGLGPGVQIRWDTGNRGRTQSRCYFN